MSAARWPIPVVSGPVTAGIWLCSVTAGGCRSLVSASPGWLTPPKRGRVSNCHAIAAPGPATCGSRSMRWPGCRKACGFATTTDYHPTGWAGPISRRSSTGWPTSSPRARSAATTATSSAAAFGPRCPGSAPWAWPGPVGSPPGCPATSRSGVTTSPPKRNAANPAGTSRRRSWPCCAPTWTACTRPRSGPRPSSASTPGSDPKTSSTCRWTACSATSRAPPCWSMDNAKADRLGRRLPISEATAAVITAQQARVRQRFPDTPAGEPKLLPSPRRNPDGRRAISIAMLGDRHREWADKLGPLRSRDGAEFDASRIVPYAYRHTFAQRHADAGVGIDVLDELIDHRNLNVTRGYYRVGEDWRRAAVDTVTAMSFDRHGNRIWRDAASLLNSEHARYAIGAVAVPYDAAPSRPTCKPAAAPAQSGSAAPAATTSAPTCPTCPTSPAISTICSAPVNASPPPSTASTSGCGRCSRQLPLPPPPSNCACNSRNATRIWLPPAPQTANSSPSSTPRHHADDMRRGALAPHLSRTLTFHYQLVSKGKAPDRSPIRQLTPGEHAALRQQREQQPVTQVAAPLAGRGVEDGAAVQDGLDLLRQQHRRHVAPAVAAHPHQRRRTRRRASVQVGQQPTSRSPSRRPAQQPACDRHPEDSLVPAVEGDQRRQTCLQRLRGRPALGRAESMLDRAAVAQPRQEPRHRRHADLVPALGLPALLEERPPVGQRRGIAAHRVRGPQVPVRLQPVLDRYDRLVTLADHRPGARPTGGPDRKTVRHCRHVPSRCRTPADNEETTMTGRDQASRY